MDELNMLFPNRPQGPQEGTIGDSAHQAEPTSDHNPNAVGVVRAWDIQVIGAPFDGQALANHLADAMRNHSLPFFGSEGYVIFNRQITAWQPWGIWSPYNGGDPHTEHIHVSAGKLETEYDNETSWNLAAAFNISQPTPQPVEDDMIRIVQATDKDKAVYVFIGSQVSKCVPTEAAMIAERFGHAPKPDATATTARILAEASILSRPNGKR
jgi:hypothetical protein